MANAFGPTIQEATQASEMRNQQRLMEMAQLDLGGLSTLAGASAGQAIGGAIGGALGVDMRPPEVVQAEKNQALQQQFSASVQRQRAAGLDEATAMENAANQMNLPGHIDSQIRQLVLETRETQAKIEKDLRDPNPTIVGPMGAVLDRRTGEPVNAGQAQMARDAYRRKERLSELKAHQQRTSKGPNAVITAKDLERIWHPEIKDKTQLVENPTTWAQAAEAGFYIGDKESFAKYEAVRDAANEVTFLWDQLLELKGEIPDTPIRRPGAAEYYRLLNQAASFEWDQAAQDIADAGSKVSQATFANLRDLAGQVGADLDFDLEAARVFNAHKVNAALSLARKKQPSGMLTNQDVSQMERLFGTYGIDTKKGFEKKFRRIWNHTLGIQDLPKSLQTDQYIKGSPDFGALSAVQQLPATPKAATPVAEVEVPGTSQESWTTTVRMIMGVPVTVRRPRLTR